MLNKVYSIINKGFNIIDNDIINSSGDSNNHWKKFFFHKLFGRIVISDSILLQTYLVSII